MPEVPNYAKSNIRVGGNYINPYGSANNRGATYTPNNLQAQARALEYLNSKSNIGTSGSPNTLNGGRPTQPSYGLPSGGTRLSTFEQMRNGGGANQVVGGGATTATASQPSATASPKPLPISTTANNSGIAGSPNRSVASTLNSPVAKGGITAVVNAVATKVGGVAGQAFGENVLVPLLSDPLRKVDQALGLRPNSQARQTLDVANKRYEKALQNQQSINPANTKGSNSGGTETPIYQPDVIHRITMRRYINVDSGGGTADEFTDVTGSVMSSPSISREIYQGVDSWMLYGAGLPQARALAFAVDNFVILGITRQDGQPIATVPNAYAPPADSPKVNTSPDSQPDYFPYFPTVRGNEGNRIAEPLTQANASQSPAYDNKPFKDPVVPAYAPTVSVAPVSASPLVNTNPSYAAPSPTAPTVPVKDSNIAPDGTRYSDNPFVGTQRPRAQPAFASKPYVSGLSDPKDYGKEIDNATGKERVPVTTTPTRTDIPPSKAQDPLTKPLNPPVTVTTPTTPNTPNKGNTQDSQSILLQLAIATGLLGALKIGSDFLVNKSTKIDNQTTPQAQQTNAKQGVCDAMQPAQCGYEGVKQATTDATNPIKDIANDNKGALAGLLAFLQALQTALTAFITATLGKLDKIKDFLDLNAKIESVKSTITLALTLHNALMLSQNLGTTLGAILDNVLNVFGQTFKTTEGTQISASQYLGSTVQQWIINIIGVQNYVALSDAFATANRIYQTGINVLSTVQSILDSAASVAQATGINVAKIGNAIRDDGVVSPKAYAHMDDSKAGNRPTTLGRFEQLTTTISDFDSKAQNLVTITAAPVQIKDAVKQSKEDIKAFNDARDVNSQANKDAKQAKLDEIKALKAVTEATIAKRDDDT